MKDRPNLIQEDYIGTEHFPWKVLVICQCLNLASWPTVEVVVKDFFERYPDPYTCDEVSLDKNTQSNKALFNLVRFLGFGERRTEYLIQMSREYVGNIRKYEDSYGKYPISKFTGCGKYACDAWDLFVLQRKCRPADKHLKRYAEKVKLMEEIDLGEDQSSIKVV
jgi:endonuclease III